MEQGPSAMAPSWPWQLCPQQQWVWGPWCKGPGSSLGEKELPNQILLPEGTSSRNCRRLQALLWAVQLGRAERAGRSCR